MFHKDLQKYAFYDRLELCIDPTHAGKLIEGKTSCSGNYCMHGHQFWNASLDK